jgi:glycosyltransferase involved in cell wall biosynthesis
MRIAFHFQNDAIPDADLRKPELGNPGIGGTEFLFAALPHYLAKLKSEVAEPILYAHTTGKLPPSVEVKEAETLKAAARKASREGADFLVFDPKRDDEVLEALPVLEREELSGVAWAHNMPSVKILARLSESESVKRLVAVGKEMLDRMRDHNIYGKSTYIYNGFDIANYKPDKVLKNGKKVVYIGSITPSKGFHILAKKWKKIEKRVPEAELIVIGSGRLYEPNSKMGVWGIAKESYERKIRDHLQGEKGDPIDSVTFKGLMGEGKIPVMQSAAVGVVNPSGKSENCPGSAIEFQACGTPVVSRAYRGLMDTVVHGETGLLGRKSKLANNITHLLRNEELSKAMGKKGIEFVKDKFSYKKICENWIKVLKRAIVNKRVERKDEMKNAYKDLKFMREANRILKSYTGLKSIPSVYEVTRKIK